MVSRRRRRQRDAAVGVVIALVVAIGVVLVWHGSDVRATTIVTVPSAEAPATPARPTRIPAGLTEAWRLSTDPAYGAVASPYGSVVTTDGHGVTGYGATNAERLWSYHRSNRDLCAVGSGDTSTDPLTEWTGVHGVMTVFAKNGYCSQVSLLDPLTGSRLYQRTSPTEQPSELFFGSPYVGLMGTDYLELWRHDLVDTIRYGNQANPVNDDGPHLGCTFSDAASSDLQLATIEHCGDVTKLVLNWPTPSDAPDADDHGWDANHSEPKATVTLAAPNAVITGITADQVALVVGGADPALVIYHSDGIQLDRHSVDIPAVEVAATAAAGITPSVSHDGHRYSLVGHHLVAMSRDVSTERAPATDNAPDSGEASAAPSTPEQPATVTVKELRLDWIADGARGLPAIVGNDLLLPTDTGLQSRTVTAGAIGRTISVDRGDYTGRVDAAAIGPMIIETRGATVVGLARSQP